MFPRPLLLLLCLSLLPTATLAASFSRLEVKGTLFCNDRRAANVSVVLLDQDTFTADDELGKTVSNSRGEFYVHGAENEAKELQPYVKFVHSCNLEPGKRQSVSFKVLPEYFNKLYDMTAVNLNIDYEGAWEEDVGA